LFNGASRTDLSKVANFTVPVPTAKCACRCPQYRNCEPFASAVDSKIYSSAATELFVKLMATVSDLCVDWAGGGGDSSNVQPTLIHCQPYQESPYE